MIEMYSKKILEMENKYKSLVELHKILKSDLKKAKKELKNAVTAKDLLQEISQKIQQEIHLKIANVVTKGLQIVFEKPYVFQIVFEKKRGKTEASFLFEIDNMLVDPITASAGGLVDVASFCLRIACLVFSKPKVRPILILDEPFKNVSKAKGYLDKIPVLLEEMSTSLEIQIIMVTHIEELKIGKVIDLDLEGE